MQPTQGQTGQETDGIEMTGVIRHQDEGTITPEMFFTDNFKAAIRAEQSADD